MIKNALKNLRKAFGKSPEAFFASTCPICLSKEPFLPLHRDYIEQIHSKGFHHSLDKFETLSLRNYHCAQCGSTDRDRLYALYITSHLQKKTTSTRLLDIAPSPALSSWLKNQPLIKYRSCDLFMTNVDDQIDVCDMKTYPEAAFDAILCSHVLEHVANDNQAIRELFRVLAPKGWAILMAPISLVTQDTQENPAVASEEERWRLYAQGDHVRLYSKNGFIKLIESAGFRVHQHTIIDFDAYAFHKHGIDSKSVLYIGHKD